MTSKKSQTTVESGEEVKTTTDPTTKALKKLKLEKTEDLMSINHTDVSSQGRSSPTYQTRQGRPFIAPVKKRNPNLPTNSDIQHETG